ncbi:hypothetical protein MMC09_004919 [Bachmanniomyces sp. S44760]|nr:hypothetical protein [Bachmanniomyces sp. S44760]
MLHLLLLPTFYAIFIFVSLARALAAPDPDPQTTPITSTEPDPTYVKGSQVSNFNAYCFSSVGADRYSGSAPLFQLYAFDFCEMAISYLHGQKLPQIYGQILGNSTANLTYAFSNGTIDYGGSILPNWSYNVTAMSATSIWNGSPWCTVWRIQPSLPEGQILSYDPNLLTTINNNCSTQAPFTPAAEAQNADTQNSALGVGPGMGRPGIGGAWNVALPEQNGQNLPNYVPGTPPIPGTLQNGVVSTDWQLVQGDATGYVVQVVATAATIAIL